MTFYDFLSLKNDINVASKSEKQINVTDPHQRFYVFYALDVLKLNDNIHNIQLQFSPKNVRNIIMINKVLATKRTSKKKSL